MKYLSILLTVLLLCMHMSAATNNTDTPGKYFSCKPSVVQAIPLSTYYMLHEACFNNDTELFLRIFPHQHIDLYNLDKLINPQGLTPLLSAVLNGNSRMVKELIAYVDFSNPYNLISLYWAIRFEQLEITEILLTKANLLKAKQGYAPVFDQAHFTAEQVKKIYHFVCYKQNKAFKHPSPDLLTIALKTENFELIKLLLEQGLPVKDVDIMRIKNQRIQFLCLHFAIIQSNQEDEIAPEIEMPTNWNEAIELYKELVYTYKKDILFTTFSTLGLLLYQNYENSY